MPIIRNYSSMPKFFKATVQMVDLTQNIEMRIVWRWNNVKIIRIQKTAKIFSVAEDMYIF